MSIFQLPRTNRTPPIPSNRVFINWLLDFLSIYYHYINKTSIAFANSLLRQLSKDKEKSRHSTIDSPFSPWTLFLFLYRRCNEDEERQPTVMAMKNNQSLHSPSPRSINSRPSIVYGSLFARLVPQSNHVPSLGLFIRVIFPWTQLQFHDMPRCFPLSLQHSAPPPQDQTWGIVSSSFPCFNESQRHFSLNCRANSSRLLRIRLDLNT